MSPRRPPPIPDLETLRSHLPGPLRFARMAGSSIASPSAGPWVTDFLNAAYYARPATERSVADLRLAHGIITTRWSALAGKRLGGRDVLALNRAYGARRLNRRGRLDRGALLQGAATLIGPWFPEAWCDSSRRAHGVAFSRTDEREGFAPEQRLQHAALGPLTPPKLDPAAQHWATYSPVHLPNPAAALELLSSPARWPDIGCAGGRFTALRSCGLPGQTFEIEVVAEPAPRSPISTRGYVTCTSAALTEGPDLSRAVSDLEKRYQAGAHEEAEPVLPDGAEPLALIVLTTHRGHFLGAALSHLLVWKSGGEAWIRDIGAWDPLPLHLAATYKAAGRAAQGQFWGPKPADRSMLAQLALETSR